MPVDKSVHKSVDYLVSKTSSSAGLSTLIPNDLSLFNPSSLEDVAICFPKSFLSELV